jgi:dimeric dUTPase (all-alpha-NTP-PPase superfamily)
MNLDKLFQTQKILRDRIGYNEPDRFNKLILALLVELGECANEHRGFKFWSQNQQPRTKQARAPYMDIDDAEFYNPLLEEYVDGLHFVLELGLEVWIDNANQDKEFVFGGKIEKQFTSIMQCVLNLQFAWDSKITRTGINNCFNTLMNQYIGLGEMLGFTWEEVEQAYYAKNKINHVRQESGY